MDHLNDLVKTVAQNPAKAWEIAKTAGELSKKLFTFGKNLKDREEKFQVDEMLDTLRDLKKSAAELEDENRELREKLRFKSDEYIFRSPFRYHRDRPDEPLCMKCFAKGIEAQMSEPGTHNCSNNERRCLVCSVSVEVAPGPPLSPVYLNRAAVRRPR
jgi:hypothetical protein